MKSRQSRKVAAPGCRTLSGLAFALLLIAAGSARAAVICVPAICDLSCTTTAATIQLGIDAAVAGDTVLVCSPGVYAEVVTPGHGAVAPGAAGIDIDKSLTLKSTGGAGTTTITNGVPSPGGHCLPTSCPGGPLSLVTLSASGITIEGFTIMETDPPINLITADGEAASQNHTFKDNHIENPTFDDGNSGGGWGILLGGGPFVNGSDNNTFTGNEINLNPDLTKNEFTFGIGLSGPGDDNNVITNNSFHDMGFGGFGGQFDTNTMVSGNTFNHLAKVGWQDGGSTSGEMILGNTFNDAGRAGLEIRFGAQNATVLNNCFSLNGATVRTFVPCTVGPCPVVPRGGIRLEDDGFATAGTMIHNNNFAGNNVPNGVTDNTAASTNTDGEAENNWWGCAAGPGNVGCDSVTPNVDFMPFQTSPETGTPCTPTTTTTTTLATTTSTTAATTTSTTGVATTTTTITVPTTVTLPTTTTTTATTSTTTSTTIIASIGDLKCYKTTDARARASYTLDLFAQVSGFVNELGCTLRLPAKRICVQVTKCCVQPPPPGGGPTAPNGSSEFLSYKLKCPRQSVGALPFHDQFGPGVFPVSTPRELLVPALPGPPNGHLKCYKTRDSRPRTTYHLTLLHGVAGFPDEPGCRLRASAKRICVQVNKQNVQPPPPGTGPGPAVTSGARLIEYKVKCPKQAISQAFVSDQFGPGNFTPRTAAALLVAASSPSGAFLEESSMF